MGCLVPSGFLIGVADTFEFCFDSIAFINFVIEAIACLYFSRYSGDVSHWVNEFINSIMSVVGDVD